MEKFSLFGGIIWAVIFILAIVGVFWNPAHFITMFIAFGMSVSFFKEWHDMRKN